MNQMPSKEIAPRDYWAEIAKMERAHVVVDYPKPLPSGEIPQLAMVVLTQEEIMAANITTDKFMRKYYSDMGAKIPGKEELNEAYSVVYENKNSAEILFRCCKQVGDTKKSFFKSPESISHVLTTDEIAVLMRHYVRTQSTIGPIVALMSQEEYEAWIDVLAEGGSTYPLDSLSLVALNQLILYMARQLRVSQTDKSSVGMPPEENTSK